MRVQYTGARALSWPWQHMPTEYRSVLTILSSTMWHVAGVNYITFGVER